MGTAGGQASTAGVSSGAGVADALGPQRMQVRLQDAKGADLSGLRLDNNRHGCGGSAPGLNELVVASRKGRKPYEPSDEQKRQMEEIRKTPRRVNTGLGVW